MELTLAYGTDPYDFSAFDIDFSQYEVDRQVDQKEGIGLYEIHKEFNTQSLEAGLRFGNEGDHNIFTSVFIAALTTKPFVILSGLSGSGKTQLATTFGQWLGREHVLVQPVRPDWVSPESLLGHEEQDSDANEDGYAWRVPRTLEFILRASQDAGRPYLLVLEEMNLAHVERYFADVLSGMESGQPIVPNLKRSADGWRMAGNGDEYLAWPENLFIVGTINVDETTYEFSPKVLDRAGVVEFRVAPGSLLTKYPAKKPIATADPVFLEAFLRRSLEEEAAWPGRDEVGEALMVVHRLFYQHTAEFGHRVFRDSLRFGSMLNEIGVTNLDLILDLIMVQRIIPKFDTKRGFDQALLLELSGLAAFGLKDARPVDPLDAPEHGIVLPRTLQKLRQIAIGNTHLI